MRTLRRGAQACDLCWNVSALWAFNAILNIEILVNDTTYIALAKPPKYLAKAPFALLMLTVG